MVTLQCRATLRGSIFRLTGEFRIPGAAGDLNVTVLLPSKTVRYGIRIDAPTEGRAKTRVTWLLRQLRNEDTPSLSVRSPQDDMIAGGAVDHPLIRCR